MTDPDDPWAKIARLKARLAEVEAERERMRNDYDEACKLVAKMHAAAVGEVRGPIRGVVEDVEDLRAKAEGVCLACPAESLAAENARLRQERDKWRRAAEVARADLWRLQDNFAGEEDELDEAFAKLKAHERCGLCNGVLPQWECELIARDSDADRAGQNTPASPPGSTQPREDGEVEGPATDTAQAQRGPQEAVSRCDCDWSPHITDMPHRAWCFSVTGVYSEPTLAEAMAIAVGAMPPGARFERHKVPPLTDPPGLDAAIEAAFPGLPQGMTMAEARRRILAAAPALRAGALREAADAIRARYAEIRLAEDEQGVAPGNSMIHVMELAALTVDRLMADHIDADRIGGAT